jgi:hypothetical protein
MQADLTPRFSDRYNRDMSRAVAKKTVERRKKARAATSRKDVSGPRVAPSPKKRPATTVATAPASQELCNHCSKDLKKEDRALFVEEEIGRVFCSEDCIAGFFGPDVERLEKEYLRHLSSADLTSEEREKYAHLRWITLQEADEVWREKTLSGDQRYTLISEFTPNTRPVWSVCICLFLRGEPSFLFLAFTTRNAEMVHHYRRGERVEWVKPKPEPVSEGKPNAGAHTETGERIDGLADDWTEEETLRASLSSGPRRTDDIPPEDFHLYQACTEETLQEPDEVWRMSLHGDSGPQLYHFIRAYPDEKPGFWMVIVARETQENDEEIEILDVFPTRDSELVGRYRQGEQEVGTTEAATPSRLVH